MKKIHILLASAAFAMLTTACYEDKGNYDYRDINEFRIDMGEGVGSNNRISLNLTMGDEIELHPTLIYPNGKGDPDMLRYNWYLIPDFNYPDKNIYTQENWNTLDFKWTPDFLINHGALYLEITDTATDIVYTEYITCNVSSRYAAAGAMILAEKEGNTQFSFIKGTKFETTTPIEFEIYNDIYFTENGEDLPQGPIKMHEHYCNDRSTFGQILIFTENGAVDISGLDFRKDIDLTEAFDAKAYPTGFGYARDGSFMSRVDLLFDAQGYLYSRLKNTDALFHSGYFLSNKLSIDQEEEPLQDCYPILAPYRDLLACVVFDAKKKRFLLVGDGKTNNQMPEQNASRPILLANPTATPKGEADAFLPVDNLGDQAEIISIDCFRNQFSAPGYSIVFHKNGKTYFQEFSLDKQWNIFGYTVIDPAVYEIKGLPGKPTFAYGQPYYKSGGYSDNSLMYCAVGNELYVFDRRNPSVSVVKYEPKDTEGNLMNDVFNGDIIAMNAENYGGRWAAVGLSSGRVLILKTNLANYPEDQIVYYSSGDYSYGTIKCVLCKTGGDNW